MVDVPCDQPHQCEWDLKESVTRFLNVECFYHTTEEHTRENFRKDAFAVDLINRLGFFELFSQAESYYGKSEAKRESQQRVNPQQNRGPPRGYSSDDNGCREHARYNGRPQTYHYRDSRDYRADDYPYGQGVKRVITYRYDKPSEKATTLAQPKRYDGYEKPPVYNSRHTYAGQGPKSTRQHNNDHRRGRTRRCDPTS